MSKKYHGAKAGYDPLDFPFAPQVDPIHKLDDSERQIRREKNQASKRSRDQHRKRNKHGH